MTFIIFARIASVKRPLGIRSAYWLERVEAL